jgi:GT2 family glycosyltransferase
VSTGQEDKNRWNLVTVTYNSAEDLRRHWGEQALPDDVTWIVVDNASSDDSADVAQQLGAVVVRLPKNVGFGAANNIGASAKQAKFVAFANPDVSVDFGSFSVMESVLSVHRRVVLAPQLIEIDGVVQPSGRGLPTIGAKIMNRLFPREKSQYQITARADERKWVSWAMGAAIVMRLDFFQELKWDDHFFVYYEDSDLGLRAWNAGSGVLLLGDVRWTHGWARETAKLSVKAWKLELASMAKFYSRYPFLLLPARIAQYFRGERRRIGVLEPSEQVNNHRARS